MFESRPGVARLLVQGQRSQDGEVWTAHARDTVLGRTCRVWWAPADSEAADDLAHRADALLSLQHPGLAPLVHRFSGLDPGTLSDEGEEVVGHAVAWPEEPPLAASLADAPISARVAGLAEVAEVLRYLHRAGHGHGALGETSIARYDGHAQVLWPGRTDPTTPDVVEADLRGLRRLAHTLLGDEAQAVQEALSGATAAEALEALEHLGVAVPPRAGATPTELFPDATEAIRELVPYTTRPLLLLGPRGSGSTGLGRSVLGALARRGVATLDLSLAASPALALHQAVLGADQAPTLDGTWVEAIRRGLGEWGWTGALFVGRLDTLAHPQPALLTPLLGALAAAGATVIAASEQTIPGALVLPVPPLDAEGTEAVVTFAGGSAGPWAMTLRRRARGRPRALAALARTENRDASRVALERLATLPPGIPARVVAALPSTIRAELPALTRTGHVWFDAEGGLSVDTLSREPIDEELAKALEPALRDPLGDTDPLWRAVTWARLGNLDRARSLFGEARRAAGDRTELFDELCAHAGRSKYEPALLGAAEIALGRGQPHHALAALRGLPEHHVEAAMLRARALRRLGRDRSALEVLDRARHETSDAWWRERAEAQLARGDRDGAEESLQQAERWVPPAAQGPVLLTRARLAHARLRAGENPSDLSGLFSAIQRADGPSPGLEVEAARILLRLGEDTRAADVLEEAARRAEGAGATLLAAMMRLELGRVRHRTGRATEARQAIAEALAVARLERADGLARRARARLALIALDEGDIAQAALHRDQLADLQDPVTPEERALAALVAARVALAEQDPLAALARLDEAPSLLHDPGLALDHALVRARAHLEAGRPIEARQIIDATPLPPDPVLARRVLLLRGRTYLGLGRRYLDEARKRLPDSPHPSEQQDAGEILLAWAGEDLDPDTFPRRQRALERAAKLLRGVQAARSERLARRLTGLPAEEEPAPPPRVPAAPRDVYGILLADSDEADALETTLAMLDPEQNNNLLLTGPTGAGKRVFAERIVRERLGLEGLEEVVLRRTDPQMLVSQLVGTRRGEFTGAVDQPGAIQRALQGRKALLLDELHTLDRVGQEILLPLLELPRRRFGGLLRSSRELEGPLQIVLATNVDVSGSRWREHFRTDLWYRMSQQHVHLPPLADRGTEAIHVYLERMLADEGFPDPEQALEARALYSLLGHPWEGNLRELHTVVRRIARFRHHTGRRLGVEDLPRLVGADIPSDASRDVLETLELNAVVEALRRADWNQTAAAERLGISKYRLHRILQKHDLLAWVRQKRDESDDDEGEGGAGGSAPPATLA